MAGYRSSFIRAAKAISFLSPLNRMISLSRQRLVVPVYHLVSNNAPPHIRHLYGTKNEKQFENDLDFLLKHYSPIHIQELLHCVRNGKKVSGNACIVTFDDGLREFGEVAAPILKRKGIPAINFLNSDFIDNRGLFFRYKACLLVDQIEKDGSLLKKDDVKQWFSRTNQKNKEYRHILFSVSYAGRETLDELAVLTGLDFREYLRVQKPYMSSGDIRTLIDQGFYFGAHSCDHPEYRYIDLDEQVRQTIESVSAVSENFGLDYRLFAFPFTDYKVSNRFFERLNGAVDISFGSAGLKRDPVPFHLQRVPMETAGLSAEDILKGEYLYYLLKGFVGKNQVRRL